VSAFVRSPVLAPFRIRNYRFQWPADLLTSWAFEMETLILGWYILVETGSVLLLTLFAALQFLGTLISPMFGVAGDRIGHGLLLCIMRTVYLALSATLAVIIFYGAATPLIVLVVAGALGCVRPSDLAVRSSLIAETMPPQDLMGAMSLSRTTQDTARIVGALAGAALFAALGLTIAYAIVATLYALGLALTICVVTMARAERPKPDAGTAAVAAVRPTLWRDLHEGMAYVWTTPQLLAAMWLAFLVNLTAYPFTNGLLPYVAREVYRIDQTGLGYLIASFAAGAIIASIGMSFAASRLWPARMMIVFAAAWYVLLLMFGQAETAPAGTALLALAGFAQGMSLVPLQVMLLRNSSIQLRGRVMGVRMLAIYGLPVGLLAAGVLIERIGFSNTVTLYAGIGLACVLLIAAHWRADLWPVQAPANAR
jgi:predicted MFS family arabinose efflux permease